MKKTVFAALFLSSLAWAQYSQATVGQQVEYNQGATWAPAQVVELIPNGYRLRVSPPHGPAYDTISTYGTVRSPQNGQAGTGGAQATAAAPAPMAQAGVGQRVEYNQGATWAPAEVLEQIPNGYRLRVYPPNGKPYDAVSTLATVRAAQNPTPVAAAPPTATPPAAKPPVNQAKTATVDNTNMQAGTPNAQIIEAVMRSMWERPADPGMDGAVSAAFQSISIGNTRPWTVLDGNQGTPGTTVWAAKVKWTHTTHYRTRNRVLVRDWNVSVFKNANGKWVVQSTASTPQSETVREDPPDM